MKKEDYIFNQAKILRQEIRKRSKLNEKLRSDLTSRQHQKVLTDLNFLGMEIGQTRERIGFAMGFLTVADIREEWRPSGFHTYPGIRNELLKICFD